MADTAARSASGPRPARSPTIMRKPPAVRMPRTGGGVMTRTRPSWIADSFCRRAAWSAGPDFRGSFARFWNGSRATKTVPELGALGKVAPEKPTKLTAWVCADRWHVLDALARGPAGTEPHERPA